MNLTIRHTNGTYISNYTLTTDSTGAFYSNSNFYPNATNITAPAAAGNYYISAAYKDSNSTRWFSEVEIIIVNQTIDILRVSSEKAVYNPSEVLKINVEAIRLLGDRHI